MPKKYPKEIRERAFRLYLDTGNINDVAVLMSIQRKTLMEWKKHEDWDRHLCELREKRYRQIAQELLNRQTQMLKEFLDEKVRETLGAEETARLIDWHETGGIDISGDVLEVRRFYNDLRRYSSLMNGEKVDSQLIKFASTFCYFGGVRWWFVCPKCGRRCYKLYRPRHRRYFACRICHQLKYRRSK